MEIFGLTQRQRKLLGRKLSIGRFLGFILNTTRAITASCGEVYYLSVSRTRWVIHHLDARNVGRFVSR